MNSVKSKSRGERSYASTFLTTWTWMRAETSGHAAPKTSSDSAGRTVLQEGFCFALINTKVGKSELEPEPELHFGVAACAALPQFIAHHGLYQSQDSHVYQSQITT